MKYELIELKWITERGNVALIKRGDKRKEYAVVRNLDVSEPFECDTQWDNTIAYYSDDIKGLQKAVECFRIKSEYDYISRMRLEEIATKLKDYVEEVIESEIGHQEVLNYFRDELDMEDYELEFLGIEIDGSEE